MNIIQAHLEKNTPFDPERVHLAADGVNFREYLIPYDRVCYFWLPKSMESPAYDFQILTIYRFKHHFFQVCRQHFMTRYEDVPTSYQLDDDRKKFLQERMITQTGIAALWDTKPATSLAHIVDDRRFVKIEKTDAEYWIKQFWKMLFIHQRKDDRIESLFQDYSFAGLEMP